MPVLRDAMLGRLEGATDDLLAAIMSGDVDDALDAWDDVRYLWRDVRKEEDTDLYVRRDRGETASSRIGMRPTSLKPSAS